MPHLYTVYILTNKNHTVLYTGVTNDIKRRILEHRTGAVPGFTQKYKTHHLVWYETGDDIQSALMREKQIKGGSRQDKVNLIVAMNPEWKDLFNET
jgi:putative endonuclease